VHAVCEFLVAQAGILLQGVQQAQVDVVEFDVFHELMMYEINRQINLRMKSDAESVTNSTTYF
jgi:hypothetical protein